MDFVRLVERRVNFGEVLAGEKGGGGERRKLGSGEREETGERLYL